MEHTNVYIKLRNPKTHVLEFTHDEARKMVESVMPEAAISFTGSNTIDENGEPASGPIIRVGIEYSGWWDRYKKLRMFKKLFNRKTLIVGNFV